MADSGSTHAAAAFVDPLARSAPVPIPSPAAPSRCGLRGSLSPFGTPVGSAGSSPFERRFAGGNSSNVRRKEVCSRAELREYATARSVPSFSPLSSLSENSLPLGEDVSIDAPGAAVHSQEDDDVHITSALDVGGGGVVKERTDTLHAQSSVNVDASTLADVPRPVGVSRRELSEFVCQVDGRLGHLGQVARYSVRATLEELLLRCATRESFRWSVEVLQILLELQMDADTIIAGACSALPHVVCSSADGLVDKSVWYLLDSLSSLRVSLGVGSPRNAALQELNEVLESVTDRRVAALELAHVITRWRRSSVRGVTSPLHALVPATLSASAGPRSAAATARGGRRGDDDDDAGGAAHNCGALTNGEVRTLASLTLSFYARLAHAFGFAALQRELEEHAFQHEHPFEYYYLRRAVQARLSRYVRVLELSRERMEHVLWGDASLRKLLSSIRVSGRRKSLYSIHQKMKRKELRLDEVYDVLALRVVLTPRAGFWRSWEHAECHACYKVLALIHEHWPVVANRDKDYISRPKPNGYRSLHTAVYVDDGGGGCDGARGASLPLEVQIRSDRMHSIAEIGSASHLDYKAHAGIGVRGSLLQTVVDGLPGVDSATANKPPLLL